MKPEVEDAMKRILTEQKLRKEDKAYLTAEVAQALELFYAISRYVPDLFHEDLTPVNWPSVYPKVMKVFRQNGEMPVCSHDFASLGPIVVDTDRVSTKPVYAILKQCRRCKEIATEPADF